MCASNIIVTVLDTLQDFLLREAGVADISKEYAQAINTAWEAGLVPTIVLNDDGIASMHTNGRKIESDFVMGVRGNGFDAAQLKLLNKAIINTAKNAGLGWPQDATHGDRAVKKKVKTLDGDVLEVNTSDEACSKFGFKPGQRIKSPHAGGEGTVVGVALSVGLAIPDIETEHEVLWLAFDQDGGGVCFIHPLGEGDLLLV